MTSGWRVAAVVAMAIAAGCCAGCVGGDDDAGDDDGDEVDAPVPADLVGGAAGEWRVTVVRGTTTEIAASDAVAAAVPLTPIRAFEARETLADYGLADPAVTVVFTPAAGGEPVRIDVGAENFDGTAFYVQRRGDERIYLVLDDQLDPLLARAGGA